jgi:Na+/H+-dicarboxylate symporter
MATITTAAPATRKPFYTSLFFQVLAGLLLGIVLGMARALGNLIGNCVATVVVAAWEGDLDRAKATQVLDGTELIDVTAG